MFKKPFTTLQESALLEAGVEVMHLLPYKRTNTFTSASVQEETEHSKDKTCIDSLCSHSREDILKTWTGFLRVGTPSKTISLSCE